MKDFEKRLIEEQVQLSEKIEKLGAVLKPESRGNVSIPFSQLKLMRIQYSLMLSYNGVLIDRLALLGYEPTIKG